MMDFTSYSAARVADANTDLAFLEAMGHAAEAFSTGKAHLMTAAAQAGIKRDARRCFPEAAWDSYSLQIMETAEAQIGQALAGVGGLIDWFVGGMSGDVPPEMLVVMALQDPDARKQLLDVAEKAQAAQAQDAQPTVVKE